MPDKIIDLASFQETAGNLTFNWTGYTGTMVGAFITFLYLDFIGSSITFVSLGQMAGACVGRGAWGKGVRAARGALPGWEGQWTCMLTISGPFPQCRRAEQEG